MYVNQKYFNNFYFFQHFAISSSILGLKRDVDGNIRTTGTMTEDMEVLIEAKRIAWPLCLCREFYVPLLKREQVLHSTKEFYYRPETNSV